MSAVCMILLGLFLLFLAVACRMVTDVRENGVYVNYFPLARRHIPADRIRLCEAVTYNPLKDYGGWGRRGARRKRAYNVRGNRGVKLELENGSVLIGSKRADELAEAIGRVL